MPVKEKSNQRTQNPSKSLKISLLRQKDDNLPKVKVTYRLYIFSNIPLKMKQTEYNYHKITAVFNIQTDCVGAL